MPVRMLITAGSVADCSKARPLIEGISAEYFLVDKRYDSDELIKLLVESGVHPVISPRKSRKFLSHYDQYPYGSGILWKMPYGMRKIQLHSWPQMYRYLG